MSTDVRIPNDWPGEPAPDVQQPPSWLARLLAAVFGGEEE